jgi:hypothetical protein
MCWARHTFFLSAFWHIMAVKVKYRAVGLDRTEPAESDSQALTSNESLGCASLDLQSKLLDDGMSKIRAGFKPFISSCLKARTS